MIVLLWVVLGLAVAGWAVWGLLMGYIWVRPRGDTSGNGVGDLGMGIAAMVILVAAVLLTVPGTLAAIWLAVLLEAPDARVVAIVCSGVVFAGVVGVVWAWVRYARRQRSS